MHSIIQAIDDVLLRRLSQATGYVGKKILVKQTEKKSEYEAKIVNVIIVPFSQFHRDQFLDYYRLYNENAVKALNELCRNFPYTPDYLLDIGYVLDTTSAFEKAFGLNEIRGRSEFDFMLTKVAF